MKGIFSLIVVGVSLVVGLVTVQLVTSHASVAALSDGAQEVCDALGAGKDCNKGDAKGSDVNKVVEIVVNTFSIIVGVVAVIMLMFGGFKYITCTGDASKVTSAKNTIIYALIGLVIVALSQTIAKVVLGNATGKTKTNTTTPTEKPTKAV